MFSEEGQGLAWGGPFPQRLLHGARGFVRVDIAKHGQDAILGDSPTLVEGAHTCSIELGQAGFAADGVQAVAVRAEEGPAHGQKCPGQQIILSGAHLGEEDLPFVFELRFGEGRLSEHLGQQFQAQGKVVA